MVRGSGMKIEFGGVGFVDEGSGLGWLIYIRI